MNILENYFNTNQEKKKYETELKTLRTKIVEEMGDRTRLVEGEYVANYSTYNTPQIDFNALLDKLKLTLSELDPIKDEEKIAKIKEAIKTVEVVDESVLESLIYNEVLPVDYLRSVTDYKPGSRLVVKKVTK